jgi:hypothetical protein
MLQVQDLLVVARGERRTESTHILTATRQPNRSNKSWTAPQTNRG